MHKPVLLAVDDDPDVLRTIERDLRREYGARYRVVVAASGPRALDALRTLQLRNESVALLLVDQRMPQMTGIEFLAEAIKLYPDAKRTLLTAYADTDAAINAINKVSLDYYLVKPWDPPETQLYPVLNDLLEQWQAFFRPPFEGIRVVGHRWSPLSYQVKDFLARNQVPYQWLDVEVDEEAPKLIELAGAQSAPLPLLIFADGTHLAAPTNAQIGAKVGLRAQATLPFYDLIIIGGGPAALASAVYGASEGLKTLMIEREAPGGQAGSSSRIENYLGFPVGLSGADLARRSVAQAKRFGVEILTPQEAKGLRLAEPYRVVTLTDGTEISCHALIIATGVTYRQLDAPGVDRFVGAGVYYGAAASEAPAYRDQDVFVVGGANSAGQAAMYFSKYCRSVTMLVRGTTLRDTMSQYLQDQIAATANIQVRMRASVVGAHGETSLESITIHDAGGEDETVPASALFIFIGAAPRTEWVADALMRDAQGFILSGPDLPRTASTQRPEKWPLAREPFLLETSMPGVFVAGDVRHGSVKRVASAVGEGAMAVQLVHQFLRTTHL